MANIKIPDADGLPKYIASTGAGSDVDPILLRRAVDGMGEVQANPTANTLLARIKSLEDKLADVKTAIEALAVATPDTAAGDMASMSADLGTIQTDIATVKADIALVKASVSNAGTAYCKTDTAASDAARRFETAEKKIMNASIQVTTNSQLFGQVDGILYQIDPGDTKSLGNIDISTLYFKNATAGQNGTVTILGVEE